MNTYEVIKSITFCYGHRLKDYDGPCRHLHGHNARVEITVATDTLDSNGMACDFRHMKDVVKGWIDTNFDHRMLLQQGDPLATVLKDQGEPIYMMEGAPTAENIAKEIYKQACAAGLSVQTVRLWEGPDSCAVYSHSQTENRTILSNFRS
jgi:6-pyruvoyltetrahydropterin/6-carboxytetrahydropterin synthase